MNMVQFHEKEIYLIKNNINDKVYIGQTSESLDKRFKRHTDYQKDSYDTKFYKDMRELGPEHFNIESLDLAIDQKDADVKEKHYIELYNSINDGYNTAIGGRGGDTLSHNPNMEEISKKLSDTKKGSLNPNSSAIICINTITNQETQYNSIKECQDDLDIPRHDIISRRCRGQINIPYQNYMFKYTGS